jgi:probable F420-dependent oxidoreductase
MAMQLGALVPFTDTGGDPSLVRDFALSLEALGYDFLEAPDHVLGANPGTNASDDPRRTIADDMFHDPFCQTALVAKQAACLDVLSGGRFRLGIGVGWNPVEFTALNENFHNRGRRSEEQAQVMQALWAQPHVTFKGRYHTIDDAGINPRPASGRVPLWYGGHHEHTLPRIAKWGDGWMPNAYPPDQSALDIFGQLRRLTEQAGRDPAAVGIEVWTSCGEGSEADWRRETAFWKQAGVSHICLTTTFNRRHHHRIAGRGVGDHLAAMKRYRDAVGDLL